MVDAVNCSFSYVFSRLQRGRCRQLRTMRVNCDACADAAGNDVEYSDVVS